jgi:hypothetical protein
MKRRWEGARLRLVKGATALLAALAIAPAIAAQGLPPLSQTVDVVRALYGAQAAHAARGEALLNDAEAARPYFADALMADGLQGLLRFDPIYNGQAHDVSNMRIALDADQPVLRGTAFVVVRFENFGTPQELRYYLRVLPGTDEFQIINIEAPGWLLTDEIAALDLPAAPHDERITLADAPAVTR